MAAPDSAAPNADLVYRLRRLRTSGTVLHVGAHPDDEEVGLVAYLSRGLDLRTVYWSATRGEGGLNRQGPERDEALGVVRTWESLEAREVDGGEVLYGPFFDFGFSKTGEAALMAWGREVLVRELVRAIRFVQPQVVLSRWSGGPRDGHGQHQAVGLVVEDAFDAAGDPVRFPDLDAVGLAPWRPSKLYVSLAPDWQPGEDGAFRPVRVPPGEPGLTIFTGGLDPVSGRTFQEMGSLAFNRHRTQGMAFVPEPGAFSYAYRRVRSVVPAPDPEQGLFDGLDPMLAGLADGLRSEPSRVRSWLETAAGHVTKAVASFHPGVPSEAGRHVLEGAEAIRLALSGLEDEDLAASERAALRQALGTKVRDFDEVAARCLGMRLEASVSPARITPGGRFLVTGRLWNQGPAELEAGTWDVAAPEGWTVRREGETTTEVSAGVAVPEDAPPTSPSWLGRPREGARYVRDDAAGALPFDPPPLELRWRGTVWGHQLGISAHPVHREVFTGGFRELAPAVLPAIALEPRESSFFVPVQSRPQTVDLHVAARSVHEDGAKGTLHVVSPEGWTVDPPEVDLVLAGSGEVQGVRATVTIPAHERAGVHEVRFDVTSVDRRPGVMMRPVRRGAPGISRPPDESNFVAEVFMTAPATVGVHVLDVEFIRSLRYAYVPGAEEQVLDSLARFGLDIAVLGEQDVRHADLSTYDAVVVGPNAYVLRDDVRANAARLLEYVERGGTLIVQFQGYAYQAPGLAPHPIAYRQPHDRVTFAGAPVSVLRPDHPILTTPNRITPADFDGWVLDRGLYFLSEWDPAYVPVLASHDPGEAPLAGGLLTAEYGRGTYVYAAYSFFKQLPAGVPGAFRLFANLLAIPEAKIRERMELVRPLELFAFMTDAQLHDVVRLMTEQRFADGESLARQGEPGGELYLILEGEVEILKHGEPGWKRFVAGRGEAVGELAALADVPRSASLVARGDVRVLAMRGTHFRQLLREHPDLADGVIQLLATRLATTEQAERPSESG